MGHLALQMKHRGPAATILLFVFMFVFSSAAFGSTNAEGEKRDDTSQPSNTIPKIQFDSLEHDFGNARRGDHLDYTFNFKNVGEATLHIEKVKAG